MGDTSPVMTYVHVLAESRPCLTACEAVINTSKLSVTADNVDTTRAYLYTTTVIHNILNIHIPTS